MVWKHFCLCVCPTPLYLKNWTLLDFHTWHVYTPPKWQERALTNIFSTTLYRSYQKGQEKAKKAARCGFFQSSRLFLHLMKQEFYITGCLNDSSFQQSKLESLNMYTSKVMKLTKGKKAARCGFFQSSRLFLHLTKHEFYITGCLNDSSFQQSKLEALNMYTSKVIKLTKVS